MLVDDDYAPVIAGDLGAGRVLFEQRYRSAEQAGDVPAMAVAILGQAGMWANENRGSAGTELIHARMRHLLPLLDPGSSLALRLRVRLTGESDYAAGQSSGIRAVLEDARRSGDAVACAEALSIAHYCLLGPGHGPLRQALATELIGVSARTGRRRDLLTGLLWRTVDLFLDGDPHAERQLAELREHLDRADHLAVGYVASALDVLLAVRADRLDEAETLAAASARRGAAAGDINATPWYGGQMISIRWYQGRIAELLPMLDQLVHSPALSPGDNSPFAALAVAAAVAGERRTAISALARLQRRGLAHLPRSSSWLVTLNGVVEAAHLLDDTGSAAEAYELLTPYADLPMVASLGVTCFGSVHHPLGVASLTLGDRDRAAHHFGEAIRHNQALGHWPATQLSHQRHAEALAAAAPAGPLRCVLDGRTWLLEFGGRTAHVGRSVGMLHLARLIADPGADVAATDLIAGVSALHEHHRRPVSAQPVLDRAARGSYLNRLAALTAEIDRLGPGARLETATDERDWLLAQLSAATGLAGRTRAFSDDAERARIAVGKAIRRTIGRIEQIDPAIGAHLRATVHTGRWCRYQPSRG